MRYDAMHMGDPANPAARRIIVTPVLSFAV